MLVFVFLLSVLVNSCRSLQVVPFYTCKDGNTVTSLLVEPCDYAENSATGHPKCILFHGSTIKVSAIFIAPFSASELEIVSSVKINNREVPLFDSGRNPCFGNIIPRCPLVKGNMYAFSGTFDVHRAYPVGAMDVTYSIRDRRSKKLLGCVIFPIVVKKGNFKNASL